MSVFDTSTKVGRQNQNLILETAGRIWIKVQDRFYELDFRNQNKGSSQTVNVTNNITETAEEPDLSNYVTKNYLKSTLTEYVTKRTWAGVKETTSMLENALLEGFTESISPITINTMQLVVGSEQLQYEFVTNFIDDTRSSNAIITELTEYQVELSESYIKHYTIDGPTTARPQTETNHAELLTQYSRWHIPAATLSLTEEGGYYVYLKVPNFRYNQYHDYDDDYPKKKDNGNYSIKQEGNIVEKSLIEATFWKTNAAGAQNDNGEYIYDPPYTYNNESVNYYSLSNTDGEYVVSQTAIAIDEEEGYYYFLYAIINTADDGIREWTPMNGFTEITPGRVTAYRFMSPDGEQYLNFYDKTFHLGDAALQGELLVPNPNLPNAPNSYIHWDSKNGLVIKGNFKVMGGDLQDVLNMMQSQIDDEVQAWFSSDGNNNNDQLNPPYDKHCEPILSTWPANTWNHIDLETGNIVYDYDDHLGDLYYITDDPTGYDPDDPQSTTYKGQCYRFIKTTTTNNGQEVITYSWSRVVDNALGKAYETIAGYEYLKAALREGTTSINGGLVLSSLIQLGNWNRSQEAVSSIDVHAGMNGVLQKKDEHDNFTYQDIAAWYGGEMLDKRDYYDWNTGDHPKEWTRNNESLPIGSTVDDIAKTVFRHDGSGYLASGNIFWDDTGALRLPGLTWENEGGTWKIRLDSGSYIGGSDTTLGDLSGFFEAVLDQNDDIIGINALYDLYAPKVISSGDVIAYANSGGGGGTSPTSYTRLDPTTFGQTPFDFVWPQYDSTKNDWVLSAALGWNLLSRFSSMTLDNLVNVSTVGAQYGQALIFNGSSWVPGDVSSQAPVVDRYFEDILNGSSILVGAHAMYDLHITQDTSTAYSSNNDKNISEILRHWSLSSGNLLSDTNVLVQGDVVAYGNSASGIAPTAYTRLDTWTGYNSSTMAGYILSAALGYDLKTSVSVLDTRVTALENSSGGGSGGGSGESTALIMPSGFFNVANNPTGLDVRTLTVTFGTSSDGTGYTLPSVAKLSLFDPHFVEVSGEPTTTVDKIIAHFPMDVSGNICATGDIVAYGTASGSVSPTAYTRLDPVVSDASTPAEYVWPTYASAQNEYVLSGALGWNLNNRLSYLEQTAGTGTVTDVSLSMPAEFSVGSSSLGGVVSLSVSIANGYSIPTTAQLGKIQEYTSLFEPITDSNDNTTIVGILAKYYLQVNGGVFASGDVVAYGLSSGSVSPTAYTRLDTWTGYNDQTMAGYVLSAHLGKDLEDRVSLLELYIGSGSGSGGSISLTLNDLSDVSTSGATNGYVLTYNNGSWSPQQASGGTTLPDVWDSLENSTSPYDSSAKIHSDHLPLASNSAFGIVKVGSNLAVTDGVIRGNYSNATTSAAGLMSKDDKINLNTVMQGYVSSLKISGDSYTGVGAITLAEGSNISITNNAGTYTISATGGGSSYTLPTASASTLGGVKIDGGGLSIDSNGKLSCTVTDTNTTYGLTLNGSSKGTSSPNYDLGTFYAPTSSGTSGQFLKSNGSGNAPTWDSITIPTVNNAKLTVKINNTTFNTFTANAASDIEYDLGTVLTAVPKASSSALGGVKINGNGLSIESDGLLKCTVTDTNTTYKLKLNNSTNGDSTNGVDLGTLYAPTSSATAGYLLVSKQNEAPEWKSLSDVINGAYLPISGGTLTGSLNIQATSSASDKEIRIYYRNSAIVYATLKVDSEGNLLLTPKSGKAVKVVGGDVVAYSSNS